VTTALTGIMQVSSLEEYAQIRGIRGLRRTDGSTHSYFTRIGFFTFWKRAIVPGHAKIEAFIQPDKRPAG